MFFFGWLFPCSIILQDVLINEVEEVIIRHLFLFIVLQLFIREISRGVILFSRIRGILIKIIIVRCILSELSIVSIFLRTVGVSNTDVLLPLNRTCHGLTQRMIRHLFHDHAEN